MVVIMEVTQCLDDHLPEEEHHVTCNYFCLASAQIAKCNFPYLIKKSRVDVDIFQHEEGSNTRQNIP